MARKKKRNRKGGPRVSPLTLLRPRLDATLSREDFATLSPDALCDALTSAFEGVILQQGLSVLLTASVTLNDDALRVWERGVLRWLSAEDRADALLTLAAQHDLDETRDALAMRWLERVGADLSKLTPDGDEGSRFFQGITIHSDKLRTMILFLYRDARHRGVLAAHFLIDQEQPWMGALKDVFFKQVGPTSRVPGYLHDLALPATLKPEPVEEDQARAWLFEALDHNRAQNIALPQELTRARHLFFSHLQTLTPLNPTQAPVLSPDDFDAMTRLPLKPEDFVDNERSMSAAGMVPKSS